MRDEPNLDLTVGTAMCIEELLHIAHWHHIEIMYDHPRMVWVVKWQQGHYNGGTNVEKFRAIGRSLNDALHNALDGEGELEGEIEAPVRA